MAAITHLSEEAVGKTCGRFQSRLEAVIEDNIRFFE